MVSELRPAHSAPNDAAADGTVERGYYNVSEAARILGVEPDDDFALDTGGSAPRRAARAPGQFGSTIKTSSSSCLRPSLPPPNRGWFGASGAAPAWTTRLPDGIGMSARPRDECTSEHIVQFYETDELLLDTIGTTLARPCAQGEAVVLVATEAHRAGFEARLEADGLDPCGRPRERSIYRARRSRDPSEIHG